jgi:hypothetical protein
MHEARTLTTAIYSRDKLTAKFHRCAGAKMSCMNCLYSYDGPNGAPYIVYALIDL